MGRNRSRDRGAATAGDDYEIAFTAPVRQRAKILAAAKAARTRVTEIGVVTAGSGVVLTGRNGSDSCYGKWVGNPLTQRVRRKRRLARICDGSLGL